MHFQESAKKNQTNRLALKECMHAKNVVLGLEVINGPRVVIWRILGGCTEIKRGVLLAGMIINVGDPKRLDGNSTNSQQKLSQQQQRERHVLGGVVLLAAALIGSLGVEVAL